MSTWPNNYMHWPSYLPLPTPIGPNTGPVPNRTAIDFPQNQFAPLYLPAGGPSYMPFRYPPNGVPLSAYRPKYSRPDAGKEFPRYMQYGPDGDINRLPPPYGDLMPSYSRALSNSEEVIVEEMLEAPVETVSTEQIIPASIAAEPVASTIDTPTFTPFEPELLVGLGPKLLARIQRLEAALARMQGMTLEPRAQNIFERLLKLHERIEAALVGEIARKAVGRGFGRARLKMTLRGLQARREAKRSTWAEITHGAGSVVAKSDKLTQIRQAYQSGDITKQQAKVRASIVLTASPAKKHWLRSHREGGQWKP